jgi:zinc protease
MTTRSKLPVLPVPAVPSFPTAQRHHLANGIEVLLVERQELPVIDLQVVLRGGAATDSARFAGRAYMTAELLDQGAGDRDALALADETELLGASIQSRASWDFVGTALHVLTTRLEPALDLLADIVMRPTFPADELERKRTERLAAILQERDEPRSLATQAFARLAFGEAHPYGSPLGGTTSSIGSLSLNDVRRFHTERFTPERAFIAASGAVTADQLLPMLEARFGGWRTTRPMPQVPVAAALPERRLALHIVDRPGAPQSELRVGIPGPSRTTPDYFALLVANTVLGGSFTSRLNIRLREEKAYTYGASSSFTFRRNGGPFLAATAVGTGDTADAVNDIVREIDRIGRETVPEPELERARSYIVLGLPRRFETTSDIAENISDIALFGLGDDYFTRYAERVRAVTADDVRTAASRWLRPEQLTIVIAGDAAATRDELESLGYGHVQEYIGD